VLSRQNCLLFENQVCLRADFCLTTSGRLKPAPLVRFFHYLTSGSTLRIFRIMVDKKLLNNSCKVEEMVQIPIKSDQISHC